MVNFLHNLGLHNWKIKYQEPGKVTHNGSFLIKGIITYEICECGAERVMIYGTIEEYELPTAYGRSIFIKAGYKL